MEAFATIVYFCTCMHSAGSFGKTTLFKSLQLTHHLYEKRDMMFVTLQSVSLSPQSRASALQLLVHSQGVVLSSLEVRLHIVQLSAQVLERKTHVLHWFEVTASYNIR